MRATRVVVGAALVGAGVFASTSGAYGQGFFRSLTGFRPPISGLSGNGRFLAVNTDAGRVARYSIETGELRDVAQGTATDISGDGGTIIGVLQGHPFATDFIWNASQGAIPFQISVGGVGVFSQTRAVSGNGSVVVGEYLDPESQAFRPFRWSSSQGAIPLGGTPRFIGVADVSSNGSTSVGWAFTDLQGARAARWDSNGVRTVMGELPGGRVDADAHVVSANGSVIFGTSSSAISDDEIYRWTATTGMVPLGAPFGATSNLITGIDAAGDTIVGNGILGDFVPFLWREDLGFVDLETYLIDQGLDLDGHHIRAVFGMSSDAMTFTGIAAGGRGTFTTFVARIPSPSAAGALAVATLMGRRRR